MSAETIDAEVEHWIHPKQALQILRQAKFDNPEQQLRQHFRLGDIRAKAQRLTNSAQTAYDCALPTIFWRNGTEHNIDWGAAQITSGSISQDSSVYYAEAYDVRLCKADVDKIAKPECKTNQRKEKALPRMSDEDVKNWLRDNEAFVNDGTQKIIIPALQKAFPSQQRSRDDLRSLIREFKGPTKPGPKQRN
ncbi:hypothetical protein [Hyphomonas oceanitis]|uniref:Uncharacterized protein n=1 Tax=Hyphomonas oceanitis SCH89 TaxID=1280953 RepID=A0A059G3B5_9PROT|nr:hypothetical protein [Hyphomonas oceanitis]KDA00948.1 hypothetical protein HOC_18054 [Hyphomonas oceanitis SCH89]